MSGISCGFKDEQYGRKLLVTFGAVISVNIGLDPKWTEKTQRPPKPDVKNIAALIDTGAEESCIDSALAARLKLPAIDRRVVYGVGSMEVDVYVAQVHVERLKYTIRGSFAGVPLKEHGHREQVLLGRTFLRDFKLVYDGKSADVTIVFAGR